MLEFLLGMVCGGVFVFGVGVVVFEVYGGKVFGEMYGEKD